MSLELNRSMSVTQITPATIKRVSFVSMALLMGFACEVQAGYLTPGTAEVAGSVPVPSQLFWWGSPSGLQRKMQGLQSHQLPPMAADANGMAPMIGIYFPDMMDGPALFSWSNPATGIGASQAEMYAHSDRTTGEPARLLMLTPKAGARATVVKTMLPTIMDASEVHAQALGAVADADLIFHQNYDSSGGLLVQEWIIRNVNAIETYTADQFGLGKAIHQDVLPRRSSGRFRIKPQSLR